MKKIRFQLFYLNYDAQETQLHTAQIQAHT